MFVPIKGNQVLLFARYFGKATIRSYIPYLYLSIHEIRSHNRVGPALWSFDGSVYGHFNIYHLELIKSTENPSGITWGERFDDHWKLFDISTTETNTSDKFPLIESGRMDFDLKLHRNGLGLSENFLQSC
jgi:phage protein U